MAVYTPVDTRALTELLAGYAVGELVSSAGIDAGIENTNYFVTTTQGEFVLTLFETVAASELPYFLNLMAWLAEHGVPSAHPVADRSGRLLARVCERPAALVQRLPGTSVERPTAAHCSAAGQLLARLHGAGSGFTQQRPNPRGAEWRRTAAERLLPLLNRSEAELLRRELEYQQRAPAVAVPQGVVHADLFRDNVLFAHGRVSGVIDFYYACTDRLIFDLAVAANDWCTDEQGRWQRPLLAALCAGYQRERTLTQAEKASWTAALRAAALRFWLSRLLDWHFPRAAPEGYRKDPGEYQLILRCRCEDGEVAQGCFA